MVSSTVLAILTSTPGTLAKKCVTLPCQQQLMVAKQKVKEESSFLQEQRHHTISLHIPSVPFVSSFHKAGESELIVGGFNALKSFCTSNGHLCTLHQQLNC
eukprot:5487330-Amphidinium_carterae.1